MAKTSITASYEDFEPFCKWHRGEGVDTLEVHLHGFRKEQMWIQLINNNLMKITGQRATDPTKISRFQKEIKLPQNLYKANEIHAKFSRGSGILNIFMPKKLTRQFSEQNKAHDQPSSSSELVRPTNRENKKETRPTSNVLDGAKSMIENYKNWTQELILEVKRDKKRAVNLTIAGAVVVCLMAIAIHKFNDQS